MTNPIMIQFHNIDKIWSTYLAGGGEWDILGEVSGCIELLFEDKLHKSVGVKLSIVRLGFYWTRCESQFQSINLDEDGIANKLMLFVQR